MIRVIKATERVSQGRLLIASLSHRAPSLAQRLPSTNSLGFPTANSWPPSLTVLSTAPLTTREADMGLGYARSLRGSFGRPRQPCSAEQAQHLQQCPRHPLFLLHGWQAPSRGSWCDQKQCSALASATAARWDLLLPLPLANRSLFFHQAFITRLMWLILWNPLRPLDKKGSVRTRYSVILIPFKREQKQAPLPEFSHHGVSWILMCGLSHWFAQWAEWVNRDRTRKFFTRDSKYGDEVPSSWQQECGGL